MSKSISPRAIKRSSSLTVASRQEQMIRALSHVVLIAGAIFMVLPFVWMVTTSLKEQAQVLVFPPQWIPNPLTFENYPELFSIMPFGLYFANSVFVSVSRTLGEVGFAIITAYAFSRLQFPGRDKIFILYLATMMIPFHVRLIPLYLVMRTFHWLDTYYALIVPTMFSAYGTFLLRQFFLTIPKDLEDAATIDGCSTLRVLTTIIVPLAKPGIAAWATFSFLSSWNDFLYPLIMTSSDRIRVIPVGIALLQNQYFTEYRMLTAASVVAVIPVVIVFVCAQRYFISGIALTGMKG